MGAGDALDHLVQAESAKMISHLSGSMGRGGVSEQGGEALTPMAVGESARKLRKSQQGVAQGLDFGIGESQGGSPLRGQPAGAMHLLEDLFGEDAVMADFLHFQQSAVGLEANLS